MRESKESRITLRDTDAGAFELMLNFIYGGYVLWVVGERVGG